MKPVANLDKDFARIQIVCSAKGEAVIQQNAAVCGINTLNIYGKTLAKALADCKVKRRVRVKMTARNGWVAV